MKMVRFLLVVVGFLLLHGRGQCQVKNDTIPSFIKGKQEVAAPVADTSVRGKHRKGHSEPSPYKTDSLARKKHSPRKATLYSTFVPGLGQIYNRKYWKLPLVWAAVGIPAYTFFYNHHLYQQTQQAIALIDEYATTGTTVPESVYNQISNPSIRALIANNPANSAAAAQSLRTYRNEYRKDQDYSVLFFLLFWGLQIVDATVDAHLMSFDVSNELGVHLQQPGNLASPTSGVMGIGLAFDLHKPKYKLRQLP